MESCIAISSSKSLLIVWAKKDAGVACVIEEVETRPVFTPFKDANSIKLLTGLKSFETPIAPLYVFSTSGHSATLIPVFAYGPGSEEFRGIYDNTDIFNKILKVTNWGN